MYLIILTALIGCTITQAIYRLYFHPLHTFPGPKIAAATFLYQFFYDAVLGGRYIWEVEKMHEKYGPIVRINPRDLHIKDSHYFDTIYRIPKQEKDAPSAAIFMSPYSMISTISHNQHRTRRAMLNNFFSKQAVVKLEPRIQAQVNKLIERLEIASRQPGNTPVRVHDAFADLTIDVITEYTYGESMGCLDDPDETNSMSEAVEGFGVLVHLMWFLPGLVKLFRATPLSVIERFQPKAAKLFGVKRMISNRSIAILQKKTPGDDSNEDKPPQTVFEALTAPSVPAEEKTLPRLEDESFVVLIAGMGTTMKVLTLGALHLAHNKALARTLREELRQVMPEPSSRPSCAQLEKLPYLTGVINESLRLSHPLLFRMARVSPVDPLVYGKYVIPPGTPISESSYFVHMDPSLFPDPDSFDPDRWIRASEQGFSLTSFLVPFSKGSRQCLGIKWVHSETLYENKCLSYSLAYAELYLTFAAVFRRFDLDLVETSIGDLRITRDLGGGFPENKKFQVFASVREVS
ncbi:hypothetical protein ASPZODRAFT_142587 [Penicilliopsis zonata CBS 506.65]|uniref:Cytochrome P450 n=1 Tax=Penicilliopsis zonata CBS 506.65 TaxID=1073090 RepID=A0A1L9SI66_9EURO|nr:hypothetical protein ASPZODRAFT_142587 [Penicilliopsis zonata CBS 506.65]OJJ46793.1 hypothetical protein ASPZODRAFT_142587 [Penicilliopsis zonata CBS 506.65]